MNNISMSIVADEAGLESLHRQQFFGSEAKEIFCAETKLQVPRTVGAVDIVDALTPVIQDMSVRSYQHRGCCVQGLYKDKPIFIEMWTGDNARVKFSYDEVDEDFESAKEIIIYVYGDRFAMRDVPTLLESKFERVRLAKIIWWTRTERGPNQRNLYLPPLKTQLHQEFYPGMPSPSDYLKNYLGSDASILLLAGPPGTGKTTLLRHLICENRLAAHVVYDEELMSNDAVFQNFLFGDGDIMVIEDADAILTSREHDQNRLMSRFLNVSDGLIKLPNKKLVFTTNISDFNKVDPALVRAGRCFGVVHTRPLNLPEAQAAAKVAGLPIPIEKGEYTLADLFNEGPKHKARTIGFVA